MFISFSFIPDVVKLLAPLCIDVVGFNSQDEIVKNQATTDPDDCPQVPLMSIDLNAKLE
jgi:hypothetical protein